ncbi:MAG: hypothetical protein Q7S72_00205 [Candidatus Taylorbacteria bacterium]|nr:hypothetical protein [Candidatus Taylorbacteria bacterium]
MKIGRGRTLKSTKYIQKQRKQLIWNIALSIFAVILLLVVFIMFVRLPFFQIKNIKVDGVESIDGAEIENIVKPFLAGNYLYFIPRSHFLLYPKGEIMDTLLLKYEKINTLKSNIKGISTYSLIITERVPHVLVCEGWSEDGENCYLADHKGYIFEIASSTNSSLKYFKYYSNTGSTTPGNYFIDTQRFLDLQMFVKNLADAGIEANGMLIGEEGSYELYIKNKDGSTAVVYFDNRLELDKTLSNLIVFWQNAMNKKIGLDSVPNFDYINLRFGNNVFYLIKENAEKSSQ